MGATRLVATFVVMAMLSAGCAAVRGRPSTEPEKAVRQMVWPAPPLPSRIRQIQCVAEPADLGIRPSFWARVGSFFAGRQETWFVRPTGIAADATTVLVTDPGAQAVWIISTSKRWLRRIRNVGQQRLVSPIAVAFGPGKRFFLTDSVLGEVFVLQGSEGELEATLPYPFRRPTGIAYDSVHDRLYVADSALHQIVVFSGDGRLEGTIGRRGAGEGEFNFPTYLAVDREGLLYVTDSLGFRVQMFTPDGRFAGQLGEHGDSAGQFASPKGLAIDSDGHIYVVEALFDAVQIFDREGRFLLTFGERGLGPGQFWLPSGIFIDARDRIYVADAYNQRIQIFEYLPGGDHE